MVILLILPIFLLLVLIGIGGLSWFIAGKLLHRVRNAPSFRISVTEINTKTITLQKTANTKRPGVFGITGSDGQAIVGPITTEDAETVTRQLIQMTGTFFPQTKVAWNTTVYGGSLRDSLQLTINEVSIPGALGDMPAWHVPGKLDTWAILVHGATGTREQGLRAFSTLAALGLNILSITYRNDPDVLASTDGLSHLGDTEWEDLEASVQYALAQGAQYLVLYGWSLGGTIVTTFLDRSSFSTSHVQAVVLDSPVLDWRATLTALVQKNSLPAFIAQVTEKIISLRTGVQFDALDQTRQGKGQWPIPLLLFHGIDDTTAPIAVSDIFGQKANVTYHRVPDADHTQCWNANSQEYEAELRAFLTQVLDVITL